MNVLIKQRTMEISVIIPLYNKASYIERTLHSVLSQSYGDFEIIVVDDGSTDDSVRIVESLEDSRIRLLRQENAGAAAARNTGIQAAKGEWIAFLDADDEWLAEKLRKQMEAVRCHPDIKWTAGGFIRTAGSRLISREEQFDNGWFESKYVLRDALLPLAYGRHIWTGTVMVKRDVLLEVGGQSPFDTSLRVSEDLDLWARMALKYPRLLYLKQPLAKYNAGLEDSLTATTIPTADMSPCVLSRRIMSMAGEVDCDRAELLYMFAQRLLWVLVNCMLRYGRNKMAKQILREVDWVDLGWTGKLLKIRSYIPGLVFVSARKAVRFVRKIFKLV